MEDTFRQLWPYFESSAKCLTALFKTQVKIKKCNLQLTEKSKQILVKRMKVCSTRWLNMRQSSIPFMLLMKVDVLQLMACSIRVSAIFKGVLPVLSNISKAFQAGCVSFSPISTMNATLEELLECNSPMEKFESTIDPYFFYYKKSRCMVCFGNHHEHAC